MRELTTKRDRCRYFTAWGKLQLLIRSRKHSHHSRPEEENEDTLDPLHAQYQQRVSDLEARIAQAQGPEHRKKRMRLYHDLAQLRKAGPQAFKVQREEHEKKQQDQQRRIQKKIDKKRQLKEQIKKEKSKEKHTVCLICKNVGHQASHCRENQDLVTQTLCYNCGSEMHTLKDCPHPKKGELKFAKCFVCKGQGHIARDCPQNPKGLYAYGGGCYICNATTHIQKDCPKNPRNRINAQKEQQENGEYFSD